MTTSSITNTIVPESERMAAADRYFGLFYVLKLEPAVFHITETLAVAYTGGYTPGLCRAAGTCLAHLVEKHELPLAFAKGRNDYPLRYCLPTSAENIGSTYAHKPLIRCVKYVAVPAKQRPDDQGHSHRPGRNP